MAFDIRRLALGTAQFGLPYGVANTSGQVSPDEAAAILRYGRAIGLDTLDTAIAYGTSEHRLGEIGVDAWHIVSKLPPVPEACEDVAAWIHTSVAGSLQRLRVQRLHAVLLHRPEQLLGPRGAELHRSLVALRAAGLVGKIGISIYDPDELAALWPRFTFDIVQAPFNILDRRLVTTGWLDTLRGAGVEVHTRSAFLQGLLLMNAANRPAYFSRWNSTWTLWHAWLESRDVTPLQACLGFVGAQAGIDRLVVGVDAVEHLRQIIDAAGAEVTPPPELLSSDVDLINPSRWSSR